MPTIENTLLLFVAHLVMQQLLNTHQSTSIFQLHANYTLPMKSIITSQLIPCLQ